MDRNRPPNAVLLPVTLTAALLGCGAPTPLPEPVSADGPLELSEPVEYLGPVAVREPMVVEHPQGDLFIAGYSQAPEESQRPPKLFRSRDRGETWAPVAVGTPDMGALGNSDVDLAVGPDGTLYFLTMGFDRATGRGTHISIGVSRDAGGSWSWTNLSRDTFDDRPWVVVSPDGIAHVIWNDGEGVCHSLSTDAGKSWSEQPRIHPEGHSSHLAVGPAGEIAVRITPLSASGNRYHEGVDLVAVSLDGGSTWRKETPPGTRHWTEEFAAPGSVRRWVEPLAWDSAGRLFHLWSEGAELWLGRSLDQGQSWESWPVVSGERPLFYPYLTARGPGELAAAWFAGSGDDVTATVATFDLHEAGPPTVRRAPAFAVESWNLTGDPAARNTGGEYLPVVFLGDGDLGVVAPIQHPPGGRQGFAWYRVGRLAPGSR